MRIEAWRVSHGLDNPKGGSALIDKEFIESIQKEIRKGIKEKEEYKEKVYNLTTEVQGRLKELQKKAQTGAYWEEYNKSTDGVLYGQNVNYLYGLEKDNPDVLISRYREFLPEQLREAGIDFSGVENSLGREITLEEYVNIMGPIWEIMREYRTMDDELRDLSICLAIISTLAAPMAMTPGGAGIAKTVDLTTGIADAGVSMLRGDTAGAALSLAIELLPEFLEDAARSGAKTIDSVDNIEVPKTGMIDEHEFSRRAKAIEDAVDGMSNSLKKYSVETFLKEMDNLPHADIPEEIREWIISLPKGQKPDPSTYMSVEEIITHLSLFDDGVVKIQSRESFEKAIQLYGSNIGDPVTGTFVIPKSIVNKAVEASDGNPRILENLLGLDPGYLGENPIIIDIKNPKNIRVPSGNEAGAWPKYWIPGGYTSGGIPEAVIDQIQAGEYAISDVYPNN